MFAREIEVQFYPFPAKWMVLTQEWIPYKEKTWRETPLNQKCDGCHTTGLNINTGDFNEYGVGCESCHGPASKHLENKQLLMNFSCKVCHYSASQKKIIANEVDIALSIKSAVCGQCHSRGIENKIISHQTKIQFNFPVEYLPAQALNKNFQQTTPKNDKNNQYWWGNGVSKNKHQEYADFARSGHARSLKNLRIKRRVNCVTGSTPNDTCLQCHSGDYIIAKRHNDHQGDKKKRILPTLDNAQDDITCVVCHDPHQSGIENRDQIMADQCQECHTKDTHTMKEHKQHFPCPAEHVSCVDCHMPKIIQAGGEFSLRSHAFRIIPPQATLKYGMPNSCQNGGCHADKTTQWAIDEYEQFYKNKDKSEHLIPNVTN